MMTRTERAQTAVTRVSCCVDGPSDDVRPRRAGKQTPRRTHRRRTGQNFRLGDTGRHTQHSKANVADSDTNTVVPQRRPEGPTLSPTAAISSGDETKTKQRHHIQPSQRGWSRCSVLSNSTYAGARFTGRAPSASLLPLPPTRWLTDACNS